MSRLEIRLLGGFEARLDEHRVEGFESQKVRGLLAYLAAHPAQGFSRDQLATLLWAEKSEQDARRNLRQALHNARQAFAAAGAEGEVLATSRTDLRLAPGLDLWLDVAVFESSVRKGFAEASPDPFRLRTAARLYAGDFLAGFFVRDSPPFEDWVISEQERLREAAIETLRTLIESYSRRGEHRLGIQFARRLLAIDPLSEEAHRHLMRLYASSGRRNRALAQYDNLCARLREELGVDPLAETRTLYESILAEHKMVDPEPTTDDEPVGPIIPLVGRREALERLQLSWDAALESGGRLCLIEGESGIGKSRLCRSFVDVATSRHRAVVLRGRCYSPAPWRAFRVIAELIISAFVDLLPEEQTLLLERLPSRDRETLYLVAPELRDLTDIAVGRDRSATERSAMDLATALLGLLKALSREQGGGDRPTPSILLIDDLHTCDEASLRVLQEVTVAATALPVLILTAGGGGRDSFLESVLVRASEAGGVVERIALPRLEESHIEEIARSLAGSGASERLARFLSERSAGLPLAISEWINHLWDAGVLVSQGEGHWALATDSEELDRPTLELEELIRSRIRQLPASARRVVSLAATIGQRFDAELLQRAAGEHPGVVEICLQILLERWLIRQFPSSWVDGRRERDLVLWAQGARRGAFEFSHEVIRRAVLSEVNPIRRQVMHREAAAALHQARGHELEMVRERLAYHYVEAGEWRAALPHLIAAGRRAAGLGAAEMAECYGRRGLEVLEKLAAKVRSAAEKRALAAARDDLEAMLGAAEAPS